MCLSETVGAMVRGGALAPTPTPTPNANPNPYPNPNPNPNQVLGGTVPASLRASAQWIPYSGGGSYTVDMVDIKISGKTVGRRVPPCTPPHTHSGCLAHPS